MTDDPLIKQLRQQISDYIAEGTRLLHGGIRRSNDIEVGSRVRVQAAGVHRQSQHERYASARLHWASSRKYCDMASPLNAPVT